MTSNQFLRFLNKHRYPNFVWTEKIDETFSTFQSQGRAILTDSELESIEPLIDAQRNKEITIKELISEMADSWADGNGWLPPLDATLDWERSNPSYSGDWVKTLENIRDKIRKIGFIHFLIRYPGLRIDEKNKYFRRYELRSRKTSP